MRYIMIILCIVALTGCYTTRKAERRLDKIARLEPSVLTKYCAKNFDNIERDSIHVKYIQGKDTTIYDTSYQFIRSNDTVWKYETITKYKTRVDTFYSDRTKTTVNSAAIDTMNTALIQTRIDKGVAESKIKEVKGTRNTLWWIVGGIALLAVVGIILKFKKIF
jgi:hypothetical protein